MPGIRWENDNHLIETSWKFRMDTQNSHIAEIESQLDVAASQEHPAVPEQSSDSSLKPPSSEIARPFEDFSFITNQLPTRERNALETLGITTVDAFCEYEFTQLLKKRGYGEMTVYRIQRLQNKLHAINQHSLIRHIPVTLHTEVKNLKLTYKETQALLLLGIATVEDFLKVDLSQACSLKDFSERIYNLLRQSRERILTELTDIQNGNEPSLANISVFALGLNSRESAVLRKNRVSTLEDFAWFDLFQATNTLNVGAGTLQSLSSKQWDVRNKMLGQKLRTSSSFSCDDKGSVFLLDLAQSTKEILWHLGITRISELVNANLSILEHASSPVNEVFNELQAAKNDLLHGKVIDTFDFSAIHDEREQNWVNEITEDALLSLPFFSGELNRGFSVNAFHESFFANFEMSRIIWSRKQLQPLETIGITTLGELLLTSHAHLLLLKPRFIKSSILVIQMRIRKLLLPPPPPPLDKSTPDTLLISLLKGYVKSERKINVFLNFIHEQSLTKVGKKFRITRERVRQIVNTCQRPVGLMLARRSFTQASQMLEFAVIRLGGFAHVRQLAEQLADDNTWNEQDCTQAFVEFLLERVNNKFECHGHGYWSTLNYPCVSCERFKAAVPNYLRNSNLKYATRDAFFSAMKQACCFDCIELPRQVTESFLDWRLSEHLSENPEKPSIQKMVYRVLKSAKVPLNLKEILARIQRRMDYCDDVTEMQIKNAAYGLCGKNTGVFLWERGGVYIHRRNIPTDLPLLTQIEERLKQMIKKAKTPRFSLYTLFREYHSECRAGGIPSAYALCACLKARNIPDIVFMRGPYVSTTSKVK